MVEVIHEFLSVVKGEEMGRVFVLIFVLFCSCGSEDIPLLKRRSDHSWKALPNSYIAGFCHKDSLKTPFFSSFREEALYFDGFVSKLRSDQRVKNLSYLLSLPGDSLKIHQGAYDSSCPSLFLTELDTYSEPEAKSLLKSWEKSNGLVFWEPNWLNDLAESNFKDLHLSYQSFAKAWWVEAIRLPEALLHLSQFGLQGSFSEEQSPVIAVLDGGIDVFHPALKGRIWRNQDFQDTGCSHDEWGCNTALSSGRALGKGSAYPFGTQSYGERCSLPLDGACFHGTHVAGILAGTLDSGRGVPGVCPFCRVMNIRVLGGAQGNASISDSAILKGLHYVSQFERAPNKNLVRVINLSFGKYQKGYAVSFYIDYLRQLRDGILVVAAAGNEDTQRRIYPAAHHSVLSVGSLAFSGRKASYSNFGTWVSLSAPGGEMREGQAYMIESSIPGGAFLHSQGTSMSSPIVAGVAGLLLGKNPDLSYSELKNLLLQSTDTRIYSENYAEAYNLKNYYPEIDGVHIPLLGSGIIDASRAVLGIKNQENAVQKKRRVQINCASTPVSFSKWKGFVSLFFWIPLIFLIGLEWIERKKTHETKS